MNALRDRLVSAKAVWWKVFRGLSVLRVSTHIRHHNMTHDTACM